MSSNIQPSKTGFNWKKSPIAIKLTIQNAFQIQPNKGLDQSLSCDVLNSLRMKYRNLSVILIDEISMVGNRMFSLIESFNSCIQNKSFQRFGARDAIPLVMSSNIQPSKTGFNWKKSPIGSPQTFMCRRG
jgi:hypothetical protein